MVDSPDRGKKKPAIQFIITTHSPWWKVTHLLSHNSLPQTRGVHGLDKPIQTDPKNELDHVIG